MPSLPPQEPVAPLEAALWEEIEQLKTAGVTPAELARVKKLLRSQTVRLLANNFYRGLLTALLYLKTGDAAAANRLLAAYEQVTAEQVQAVARKYLTPDNRTVVVVQPVTPEEDAALGPVC